MDSFFVAIASDDLEIGCSDHVGSLLALLLYLLLQN